MKSRPERKQEQVEKALIKILQSNAETEEEAIDRIREDVNLYEFSTMIRNIYASLEDIREQMRQIERDAVEDYLKDQCNCSCCCCGGGC